MRPKYGFTTYSCSCFGSVILGLFLALLVTAGIALLLEIPLTAYITDLQFLFLGFPLCVLIATAVVYFAIWTRERAFAFISWVYQDFWTSGKNIWS